MSAGNQAQALFDRFENLRQARKTKAIQEPTIASDRSRVSWKNEEVMLATARRRLLRLSTGFMLFFICGLAAPSYAQFNSGFTGVVVEQSGAVVPGARVTATNQSTEINQFTRTSDSGSFRI